MFCAVADDDKTPVEIIGFLHGALCKMDAAHFHCTFEDAVGRLQTWNTLYYQLWKYSTMNSSAGWPTRWQIAFSREFPDTERLSITYIH